MKTIIKLGVVLFVSCLFVTACKDDNNIFKPNRSTITGHVYDHTGMPIAGAVVSGTAVDTLGVNAPVSTLTDNSGYYSLKDAPLGYMTLSAQFGTKVLAIGVHATQDLNALVVDFIIVDDITLQGLITDNNGRPLKEAEVSLERQDSIVASNPAVKTDSYGRYTVFNLAVGTYKVKVDFPSLKSIIQTYSIAASTSMDTLNIKLDGAPRMKSVSQLNTQASIATSDSIHFTLTTLDEYSTNSNFAVNFIATIRTSAGQYVKHYDFSQTDVIGELLVDFSIPAVDLLAGDYKVEFQGLDNDNNFTQIEHAEFSIVQ